MHWRLDHSLPILRNAAYLNATLNNNNYQSSVTTLQCAPFHWTLLQLPHFYPHWGHFRWRESRRQEWSSVLWRSGVDDGWLAGWRHGQHSVKLFLAPSRPWLVPSCPHAHHPLHTSVWTKVLTVNDIVTGDALWLDLMRKVEHQEDEEETAL